jgi:hypothetical protein
LSDSRKSTIEDELLRSEDSETPIQFLLLSETHAKSEKDLTNWIKNSKLKDKYHIVADSEHTELKSKGTAIIYSSNWHPHRIGVKRHEGTVISISFQIRDKLVVIGSVYKPTKNKENDKLIISTENFLASIIKQHKALEQGEKQTFLILGGDWNNELNPSLDRAYVGMSNAQRSIETNCHLPYEILYLPRHTILYLPRYRSMHSSGNS